jgi:ABC-type transporter Mla subunit MlaD
MGALMVKVTAILAGLMAGAGALAVGLSREQTYSVTAHFISAEGLVAQNDVNMSGVKIGTVSAVHLAAENDVAGGAIVTMQIAPRFAPLRQGTKLLIRQKGFLGNDYVEVTAGSAGNPPIPNGGAIPIQDTAAPVALDQVMDMFDPNVRAKIKTMTLEGQKTLSDNGGQDINQILASLPGITSDVSSVAGNLDEREKILDDLTVEFDRIALQIASEDQHLRGDFRNGASILNLLAQHQTQLQAELVNGNQGLSRLNQGIGGHEGDINALLKSMPQLEDNQKALTDASQTPLTEVDACIGDIVTAIDGLRAADVYKHPQGSTDGAGYTLRVFTHLNNPVNGSASSGSVDPLHDPSIPHTRCEG